MLLWIVILQKKSRCVPVINIVVRNKCKKDYRSSNATNVAAKRKQFQYLKFMFSLFHVHVTPFPGTLRTNIMTTGSPHNLFSPLTVPYNRRRWNPFKTRIPPLSFYSMEQSTANSNSFKIAQKTAFEAKGRLYTTGKVIQRLFIIDLYT